MRSNEVIHYYDKAVEKNIGILMANKLGSINSTYLVKLICMCLQNK